MLKRFVSYFKPYKTVLILDLLAAVTVGAIDLVYPLIAREVLNVYIKEHMVTALLMAAGILIACYVLKAFLNYFMGYRGHVMSAAMQKDMRRDLFAHLEKLPVRFFDENKTGVLISRATGDLQDVSELAHHGPEDLLTSVVLIVGSSAIMLSMNWLLSLILILCLPPMVMIVALARKKMRSSMRATRVRMGEMSATLENSLTGIRVSKAYGAEKQENALFGKCNEDYYVARNEVNRSLGSFNATIFFCYDFIYWIILLLGGLFVIFSETTTTAVFRLDYVDLVTFMLYVNAFLQPLRKLASFMEQYQNGMSGFRRFHELMEESPEEDDDGATDLTNVKGEIAFHHVTFAYSDGGDVLSDVSFHVEKGKTLALVGPTGGGKSTICHLIPRFYEIQEGKITVDGKNIRSFTRASLRRNVGIVAQDLFLFDASIYDNIAYGRPDATREEVIEAARLANLSGFIETLPEGIDTLVGERGVRLSGGQKQRVAIARAFLKNPPILILDEATSALDTVTEREISESLAGLSEGRTVIVVAHRLSTVRNADEILVVGEKGIRERGTHGELLALNGEYAALCRAVSRTEEALLA